MTIKYPGIVWNIYHLLSQNRKFTQNIKQKGITQTALSNQKRERSRSSSQTFKRFDPTEYVLCSFIRCSQICKMTDKLMYKRYVRNRERSLEQKRRSRYVCCVEGLWPPGFLKLGCTTSERLLKRLLERLKPSVQISLCFINRDLFFRKKSFAFS